MKLPDYTIKILSDSKNAVRRCKCPPHFTGAAGRAHTLWCPAYTWYQERRKERTVGGQAPSDVDKLATIQTRLDWITKRRYGRHPFLVRKAREDHLTNNRRSRRNA